MKLLSALAILFHVLILQEALIFSVMADIQLIHNTCKGTPFNSLCLSILMADPKSQNADLTGLALIVVDTVKNKGIQTLQRIGALKNSRPELTSALAKCKEVYNTAVSVNVPLAINALKLGNAKFAEGGMADIVVESQACERSFQTTTMINMNKVMEDVANVGRGIIRMLL